MIDFAFIDSGVGGIPYMTCLLKKNPGADCVYVADNANFPYGQKSHEHVVGCVLPLVQKIKEKFEPRVIVLACNTISVNALDVLRQKVPEVIFVGTVPAIKLAASVSAKKRIGLLATRATVENPYNIELKNKFAADCQMICRADPDLIEFIENKGFGAAPEECLQAVQPAVSFFRKQDCDVIILGCTHFLNIREHIEQACAPDIKVVDSVDGVVRHALEVAGLDNTGETGPASVEKKIPRLYITKSQDMLNCNQYKNICFSLGVEFKGVIE